MEKIYKRISIFFIIKPYITVFWPELVIWSYWMTKDTHDDHCDHYGHYGHSEKNWDSFVNFFHFFNHKKCFLAKVIFDTFFAIHRNGEFFALV
jgi:hypothetical protein